MSNRNRLQTVPSLAAAVNPPPLHVYAIAPRNDGLWGVWCYACSQDAGEYVFPCKVLPVNGADKPRPPQIVAAPPKVMELVATRDQLHVAQGALAHIAQLLGLWDDGEDTLNTKDIYDEIERLVAAATEGHEGL